ncbi:MAG TPA: response regulator, partial [Gemmatimonadota bacterium]|nr:response regulator [Gemmatimonadota bacterium]
MRAVEPLRREERVTGLALVVMPRNAPDRDAVRRVVERMGFRIEQHHDAGTALEAVEYAGPGLVVHAWDLPDMDGATFHNAVQKRAGGRRVPTLAIMPADRSPDQQVGAQTGIMEYICRPFEDEALRSRLSGLLIHLGGPAERMADASRKEPEMIETTAPVRPAENAGSRTEAGRGGPNVRFIGLGEWGIRGAELLAERGVTARCVDTEGAVDRSRLDAARRHRVALSAGVYPDDWAGSARALTADAGVGEALAADGAADLIVVGGDLAAGSGALLGVLLRRVARDAPRAGRLAVARLPGLRSGP